MKNEYIYLRDFKTYLKNNYGIEPDDVLLTDSDIVKNYAVMSIEDLAKSACAKYGYKKIRMTFQHQREILNGRLK